MPRDHKIVGACAAVALGLWMCTSAQGGDDLIIDLGRGPVTIHVPPSYEPGVPTPLVLLLHGYCSNGSAQEAYMQFMPLADEHGFLYAHPDGLIDFIGCRYWNGTDACCDFFGNTDDSGYLQALIDEVKAQASVDDRRVFLIGHSNGGFMSYRMACDHPDTIAAIASLAGATFIEPDDCSPAAPVHTLQIHGTLDLTILYNGGCFAPDVCYPGAVETTEQWADFDGCLLDPDTSLPPLDLDAGIPGDETLVWQYSNGCDPNGSAELWTIVGGAHSPNLSSDFSSLVIEFLLAHPKSEECDGDANGDGTVDPLDSGYVLARFGCLVGVGDSDCDAADQNGDGAVDPLDSGFVLARFGPCE